MTEKELKVFSGPAQTMNGRKWWIIMACYTPGRFNAVVGVPRSKIVQSNDTQEIKAAMAEPLVPLWRPLHLPDAPFERLPGYRVNSTP